MLTLTIKVHGSTKNIVECCIREQLQALINAEGKIGAKALQLIGESRRLNHIPDCMLRTVVERLGGELRCFTRDDNDNVRMRMMRTAVKKTIAKYKD